MKTAVKIFIDVLIFIFLRFFCYSCYITKLDR